MSSIISFIKANIVWIKDIFTVLFTGAATIIGILTYKRARATLLQPIRNEVIKKQSQLLSELLTFINKKLGIESQIDYVNIASVNVFQILRDYGFILHDNEQYKQIDQITCGCIYCVESGIIRDVEVIGSFVGGEDKSRPVVDVSKERYEEIKKGIYSIDKIYFTTTFDSFVEVLRDYSDNPFLPKKIQAILIKIKKDIHTNLTVYLKEALIGFLKEFSTRYFSGEVNQKVSPWGVYNSFNHNRLSHKQDIAELYNEIRKYLMIDEEW